MPVIREVCELLESWAPPRLAEDWDNVGLLVGDADRSVARIMTCLTVTPESAEEAIEERADLIVTHHPLPFRPLKRLTVDTTIGRLLWQIIGARIAVYSPHTGWDSSRDGINQQLAAGLGLHEIEPLERTDPAMPQEGHGRQGQLPAAQPLSELVQRTCRFLSIPGLHHVGNLSRLVQRVGVACGSAGQFLAAAHRAGCDVLVTGETSFHTCLEASAVGVSLLLPGHYASERFAMETLAERLREQYPVVQVWASRAERDPLMWVATRPTS